MNEEEVSARRIKNEGMRATDVWRGYILCDSTFVCVCIAMIWHAEPSLTCINVNECTSFWFAKYSENYQHL